MFPKFCGIKYLWTIFMTGQRQSFSERTYFWWNTTLDATVWGKIWNIGGLAIVAFWRSPHGPLGSGPPRAGYSQRRKRKEKGKEERKKEGERKGKEKKRREEREEDLRPIWAAYSVFRLCMSLYTRPLILQLDNRPQVGLHITDIGP